MKDTDSSNRGPVERYWMSSEVDKEMRGHIGLKDL